MEQEDFLKKSELIKKLQQDFEKYERNRSISFKLADIEGAKHFIQKRDEAKKELEVLLLS